MDIESLLNVSNGYLNGEEEISTCPIVPDKSHAVESKVQTFFKKFCRQCEEQFGVSWLEGWGPSTFTCPKCYLLQPVKKVEILHCYSQYKPMTYYSESKRSNASKKLCFRTFSKSSLQPVTPSLKPPALSLVPPAPSLKPPTPSLKPSLKNLGCLIVEPNDTATDVEVNWSETAAASVASILMQEVEVVEEVIESADSSVSVKNTDVSDSPNNGTYGEQSEELNAVQIEEFLKLEMKVEPDDIVFANALQVTGDFITDDQVVVGESVTVETEAVPTNVVQSSGAVDVELLPNDEKEDDSSMTKSRSRRKRKFASCVVCEQEFCEESELWQHKTIHDAENLLRFAIHDPDNLLRCGVCQERFMNKDSFEGHISTESRESPFSCCLCKQRFPERHNLRQHQIDHLKERFLKCSICSRTYKSRKSLEIHKKQKHEHEQLNPKYYRCEFCPRWYLFAAQLARHKSRYHRKKHLKCSVCGMAFSFNSKLSRHMQKHMVKTPYHCTRCNSYYSSLSGLEQHQEFMRHKEFPDGIVLPMSL